MESPTTASAPGWRGWPFLAVLVGPALVAALLWPTRYFLDVDDYYHVHLAEVMARQGLRVTSFPWATYSIWRDLWFDKDWLFHVVLVPFLSFGRIIGPQILIVVLNLGVAFMLWRLLKQVRGRGAALWLAVAWFSTCEMGLYRQLLCRPHLLSQVLLLASLFAMVGRRHGWLGLGSMLYALAYTGHWQLPILVAGYDLLLILVTPEGRWRRDGWRARLAGGWPLFPAALLGMFLGEVLHPQFPDNLRGLVLQNIEVLRQYWQGGGATDPALAALRPMEIRPAAWPDFLWWLAPILIGLLLVAGHSLLKRRRWPRQLWLWSAYTALYLFMAWKSIRFLEYLWPRAVIFLAHYVSTMKLPDWPHWPRLALGLGGLLLLAQVVSLHNHWRTHVTQRQYWWGDGPLYARESAWLKANLAPGELVFSTRWSDPPALWFGAPEQHYLVFLDVYFMYARDPERVRRFYQVIFGQDPDPVATVRDYFGSHTLFTMSDARALLQQLDADPRARRVLNTGSAAIYQLGPDLPASP
jgi:hypothetical protein